MAAQTLRSTRAKKAAPNARKTIRKRGSASASPTKPALSKLDAITAALRTKRGVSITDLMTLTGWQMHSVRGCLAGALKKKRGLDVVSSKVEGERRYRIEGKA